jgi:hypothetical protein
MLVNVFSNDTTPPRVNMAEGVPIVGTKTLFPQCTEYPLAPLRRGLFFPNTRVPKAQIRQSADRVSAPTRRRLRRAGT